MSNSIGLPAPVGLPERPVILCNTPSANTPSPHRRAVRCAAYALCTALGLLLAGCGGKAARPVHGTGQLIVLSDSVLRTGGTDTVRFGHLHAGETAVKEFRLYNGSSQPLVVLAVERTCGCTRLELDSEPLAPGSERAATLAFDSGGLRGWQFKLVEIRFAQAAAPFRLYVDAEVE